MKTELTSKYHASKSQFIEIKRFFQGEFGPGFTSNFVSKLHWTRTVGPSLPPSNAVRPYDPRKDTALPPDYHPALKGKTLFFFKIAMPKTSPASIQFGGPLASISYRAKAGAEAFWRGDRRLVVDAHDIIMAESLDDEISARREDLGAVVVGEGGKLWAHGRIMDTLVIAGQSVMCRLHVKNNSVKKVCCFGCTLVRHDSDFNVRSLV